MSVDCNFKEKQSWRTTKNTRFSAEYQDVIADVVIQYGNVCTMKLNHGICDEERCIFWRDKLNTQSA
jgi:hypothetical protein